MLSGVLGFMKNGNTMQTCQFKPAALWVSVAVIVACLCLGAANSQAQQGPPALVRVADAETVSIAPTQAVPATVHSVNQARIAAEVQGRLQSVLRPGAVVRRGERLVVMDGKDLSIAHREAEAAVRRERARLGFLDREVARLTELTGTDNVSRSQLEQTESERDVSREDLTAAEVRLERAQSDLEKLQIRAPFDGVVTERFKRAGEWVKDGDEVIAIADPNTIEIRAAASVANLPHLAVGQTIAINGAIGGEEKQGLARIASIVNVGDPRSGLYEVIMTPLEARWHAGETLRAALPTSSPRRVVAVPRDALVIRRGGISVYRVADDKAEQVQVRTGVADTGLIEIIGEVKDGDQVIVRGNERLRPGQNVVVAPGGEGGGGGPGGAAGDEAGAGETGDEAGAGAAQ